MFSVRWTAWQLVKCVTTWLEKKNAVDIINYLFSYISEAFRTTKIWSFLTWIADYCYFLIRTREVFIFRPHIGFSSSYFRSCSCCNLFDCLIGCCQQIDRITVLPIIVPRYKAEFIQVSNFFLNKFVPAEFCLKLMFVLDSAGIIEVVERTSCSVTELLCSSLHDKA